LVFVLYFCVTLPLLGLFGWNGNFEEVDLADAHDHVPFILDGDAR